MIAVQGAGWLTSQAYGRLKQGDAVDYADRCSLRALGRTDQLFEFPIKNYGRFEPVTQRICCVTALALQDAGILCPEGERLDIGLLGVGDTGCVQSNIHYFKDYVDAGRTLSRANLFIYTLPSSPLAEAAVHFGLQGPLLYLRPDDSALHTPPDIAEGMIQRGEAAAMLIYLFDDAAAFCMLAGKGANPLCSMEEAGCTIQTGFPVEERIRHLISNRNAREN